jgi:hypothetical protein
MDKICCNGVQVHKQNYFSFPTPITDKSKYISPVWSCHAEVNHQAPGLHMRTPVACPAHLHAWRTEPDSLPSCCPSEFPPHAAAPVAARQVHRLSTSRHTLPPRATTLQLALHLSRCSTALFIHSRTPAMADGWEEKANMSLLRLI